MLVEARRDSVTSAGCPGDTTSPRKASHGSFRSTERTVLAREHTHRVRIRPAELRRVFDFIHVTPDGPNSSRSPDREPTRTQNLQADNQLATTF